MVSIPGNMPAIGGIRMWLPMISISIAALLSVLTRRSSLRFSKLRP
jgi:hypothetical protein